MQIEDLANELDQPGCPWLGTALPLVGVGHHLGPACPLHPALHLLWRLHRISQKEAVCVCVHKSLAWQVVSGHIARGGAHIQKPSPWPQKEHLLEFLACWPPLRQEEGLETEAGS